MFLVKTIKLALKIHRPLVQYGEIGRREFGLQ
jgi:hypothetical protein